MSLKLMLYHILFRIYGSNDGSSWIVIHDQTSALVYSGTKSSMTVQSSSTYTYIALVVSALPAGGTVLNFVQWNIYGKVCAPQLTCVCVCV
jgi:hypothetical protein